eukprot:CAMPEP_0116883956 /NCGR_PEP_ID=MMETSP0463-20121206/16625_1 /TAXON_ID=181622 /ORGANISM="Strombidinopsis sp, Strain SopsisLIS2011" /LENGTH=61 /DNA_ID=CAMNT_0004539533 /DNA_START=818 /DNA_END=1003 /DNA_ORIENTATION=-
MKDDSPCPGSYNVDSAYKVIKDKSIEYKMGTFKPKSFVTKYSDAKKFVPGSGTYDLENSHY